MAVPKAAARLGNISGSFAVHNQGGARFNDATRSGEKARAAALRSPSPHRLSALAFCRVPVPDKEDVNRIAASA
jgi:hypothetical protein